MYCKEQNNSWGVTHKSNSWNRENRTMNGLKVLGFLLIALVIGMCAASLLSDSKANAAEKICINGVCYDVVPEHYVSVAPVNMSMFEPMTVVPRAMRTSGPSWTYPGNIYTHMQKSHGVSCDGMSISEAEAYHSSLHNAGVSTSTRATTTTRTRSRRGGPVRAFISSRPIARLFRCGG